ncbi:hypothetical protein [Brachybacterium sp. FME24]|uniref:hypothetical protein n=1 Tax=Brachybacterium sp. FME24 TaxID=2742605 RepID=UPI0018682DE9|nr:hypothetical protein [Brachybacterium sp. FME24]
MTDTMTTTRRLPLLALVGLALLGVPRVVLHDLDILQEGTLPNALFVALPLLIWIAVVLWRRVPRPLLTLLAVGAIHGVLLALTHQLLWNVSLAGDVPQLGGNLAGLDPTLESVIIRGFAAISSLVTGVVIGALTGLLAWALSLLRRRQEPVAG